MTAMVPTSKSYSIGENEVEKENKNGEKKSKNAQLRTLMEASKSS